MIVIIVFSLWIGLNLIAHSAPTDAEMAIADAINMKDEEDDLC